MKARLHCNRIRVSRVPGEHPVEIQAGSVRLLLTTTEAVDLADTLIDATEQSQEDRHV